MIEAGIYEVNLSD